MKRIILVFSLGMLLTSCSPKPEQIKLAVVGTLAAIPTNTPYPTYTSFPTYTIGPTSTPVIIIVTQTLTATPLYTPTITLTPTKTLIPSPTLSPLQTKKGPGVYLVGVDIAAGLWRNDGTGDDCYWSTNTMTGKIIDNYFGFGGGTMYIVSSAFQVEMHEECGYWTYMGPP